MPDVVLRLRGVGFGVWGLGFEVWGLLFGVCCGGVWFRRGVRGAGAGSNGVMVARVACLTLGMWGGEWCVRGVNVCNPAGARGIAVEQTWNTSASQG